MLNRLPLKYLLPGSLLWVFLLLSGCFTEAQATHIRAGDITAKRDTTPNPNPRRFFFTMNIYRNTEATANDPEAVISMGDGNTVTVPRDPNIIQIGNRTEIQVFKWSYTYGANGTYTISWNGINRNGGILNIAPPSDQVTFYISTTININPLRGYNSTPVLRVYPIDLAAVGRKFVHNPGAFDSDGDSLAFKLRVPQRITTGPTSVDVPGYSLPDRTFPNCRTSDDSGPAFMTLDLHTGQLTWDSPCVQGEYNVAFVVEEWRVTDAGAVKLGEVVRDMQILVEETPNRPPVLTPKDTCIVAGTILQDVVRATDPDNDLINLTAVSGILPPATFRQTLNNPGTAAGTFRWETDCQDVRAQPYQVIFKAEDVRPPVDIRLVDLQPWNITVVGPAPENLSVRGENGTAVVTWDPYVCANASVIRIYRREGPSGFVPGPCETGVPGSTGYVLVGEVPAGQTSFTDTNGGAGLTPGVDYCYIIYAEFGAPGRGQSLASNEACVSLERDVPYLTHVTVEATDAEQGRIRVRWTQPLETSELTPPFRYRLLRKEGQSPAGGGYVEVKTTTNLADTVHVDAGLNTAGASYRYRLEFYHSPGGTAVLRDSASASSVRLEAVPAAGDAAEAVLTWSYAVPWSNAVLPHRIYRRINGEFVLIDSVMAGAAGGTYTDRGTFGGGTGLERGTELCYFVEAAGTYQTAGLPEPLLNRSQEACLTVPLLVCAPVLSIDALDCEDFLASPVGPPYANVLTWTAPGEGEGCTEQIAFYTVYFRGPGQTAFVEVGRTEETTFTHGGLESFAGCYAVTATDADGRESARSNEVCKDNCLSFLLPNVITPNGDGLNDVFRPDARTRFIKSMRFKVFNRWGVKVYEGTDPYINWPGTDTDGNRLTDGTYYYEADAEFFTVDPSRERARYKGWVELVR